MCPSGAQNGQILLDFLLLCCRPRKGRFKRKRAVSGPSAHLGPEMVKFCPNFCCCAADQEKVVFKRKRTVSSLFGWGRPTRPPGRAWALEAPGGYGGPWSGLQGTLPCECQQRRLREASGRGLRGPRKRTIWRLLRF